MMLDLSIVHAEDLNALQLSSPLTGGATVLDYLFSNQLERWCLSPNTLH